MNIECKFCNYINDLYVINKHCENCKATILYNKKSGTNLMNSEYYQRLIEELSSKLNIEKNITKKMIDFRLFEDFKMKAEDGSNNIHLVQGFIVVLYPEGDSFIFISKELHKENNNSIISVFLNYIEYNNDYFFKEELLPYLFSKEKVGRFLTVKKDLNKTYSDLLFLIEYKFKDFSPYPIEWLNEEEKLNLIKNVQNNFNHKKYKNKIKSIHFEHSNKYINCCGFQLNINKDENLETIYSSIKNQIKIFENDYDDLKMKLKEENKFYFQRSLLEREIGNF